MKKKMMIIDDSQEFVEMVFKPKLKQWGIDDEVISNLSFGDIAEDLLPGFTKEVIDIALASKADLGVVFLDLALTKASTGNALELASQGFRLAKELRKVLVDVPIIALTQFAEKEVIEEGYLYDLDHYVTKTSFGDLGSRGFNGIVHQAIKKRQHFVDSLPSYYERLLELTGEAHTTFAAFGRTFTTKSRNMEAKVTNESALNSLMAQSSRHTVVFFADMCNSTEIKERQGFYEGLNLARVHNQIVTEAISSRDGTVVKFIGDCVMARFDYDEEAAVNADAVLCAVNTMEALFAHNREFRRGADFQLISKIGIAVGKTVDFYGNDPHGPCVDLASRLQSEAKPGQILISSEMRSLINTAHLISTLGKAKLRLTSEYICGPCQLSLKGFSQKQDVFEIVWGEEPLGIGA